MKLLCQELYTITLYEPITGKTEISQVLLHKRGYKNMSKRLNEIVYIDEEDKEWALQEIKLNDRRTT